MSAQDNAAGPDDAPLVRFELDVQADRQTSVIRGVAAAILLLAGLWTLLLPFSVPRMVAVIGFVFAGLWLVRAAGLRRRALHPESHFLELWPDRLVLGDPEQGQELAWDAIAGIELDEDALVVRLHTRGGDSVVIEPCYRGIALYDLRDAIAEAWQEAGRGCASAQDD
ncbi:MAG: hypothetical protein OXT09_29040 [Myxococcales bacterium]|nr:hypothetical protein [Myxococcales bacterium]